MKILRTLCLNKPGIMSVSNHPLWNVLWSSQTVGWNLWLWSKPQPFKLHPLGRTWPTKPLLGQLQMREPCACFTCITIGFRQRNHKHHDSSFHTADTHTLVIPILFSSVTSCCLSWSMPCLNACGPFVCVSSRRTYWWWFRVWKR